MWRYLLTSFDTKAWVGITPSDTLKTSGEPSQPCQQIIILKISSYTRCAELEINRPSLEMNSFYWLVAPYWLPLSSILASLCSKIFLCYINKHFESSQKLRKDGFGIWKNFIGNMLSNYILWFWLSTNTYYLSLHLKLCYLNWKWVESDRHLTCYWSETQYRTEKSFY